MFKHWWRNHSLEERTAKFKIDEELAAKELEELTDSELERLFTMYWMDF